MPHAYPPLGNPRRAQERKMRLTLCGSKPPLGMFVNTYDLLQMASEVPTMKMHFPLATVPGFVRDLHVLE